MFLGGLIRAGIGIVTGGGRKGGGRRGGGNQGNSFADLTRFAQEQLQRNTREAADARRREADLALQLRNQRQELFRQQDLARVAANRARELAAERADSSRNRLLIPLAIGGGVLGLGGLAFAVLRK